MAVLEGLPAGSSLEGLSFLCLDEAGRPAAAVKGRLQTSWSRGTKRVALKEDVPVDLPRLPVSAPPLNSEGCSLHLFHL